MKRRIFTFLLAAALVLLTACSGRGTEPPVRIGEAIGEASLLRSYSAAEAFRRPTPTIPTPIRAWAAFPPCCMPPTRWTAPGIIWTGSA